MQPHITLFCTLFLAGCFHDPNGTPSDGTTTDTDGSNTDQGSSDGESDTGNTDTDSTESWTDVTSSSVSDSGATTDTTTGTTTTGSTNTSSDGCAPVDVPIDGAFEGGENRTVYLDFDGFPGSSGDDAELCITFTTDNGVSARSIFIEGQVLQFGPCNALGPPPGPFTICDPFVKPAGVTEVIIDNTTPGPGCQTGSMDNLVLQFMCL